MQLRNRVQTVAFLML